MRNKFDDFDITEQWLGKVSNVNDITRKHVRKYRSPFLVLTDMYHLSKCLSTYLRTNQ